MAVLTEPAAEPVVASAPMPAPDAIARVAAAVAARWASSVLRAGVVDGISRSAHSSQSRNGGSPRDAARRPTSAQRSPARSV